MFDYEIIATGSTGNAVLITVKPVDAHPYKILIDVGIPYKRLKSAANEASFVFISHKHSDHIKTSAYNRLRIEHPRTTILTNQETADFIAEKNLPEPHVIVEDFQSFYLGDMKITALPNEHGVQCHGWIFELNGKVLLYATDLSTTLHYKDYLDEHKLKVDYLLLEGNYDINVFKYYVHIKGESITELFNNGSSRHLPIHEWENFKEQYTRKTSRIEMLHTSLTYATPQGLIAKMNSEREKLNRKNGTNYPEMKTADYYTWLKGATQNAV